MRAKPFYEGLEFRMGRQDQGECMAAVRCSSSSASHEADEIRGRTGLLVHLQRSVANGVSRRLFLFIAASVPKLIAVVSN